MDCTVQGIPYEDTGYFSALICDYLREDPRLLSLYRHAPRTADWSALLQARAAYPTRRDLLYRELSRQYEGLEHTPQTLSNLEALNSERTFTICTAHQPNLFTGHLYFVYKILHTIRLAEEVQARFPDTRIVPVYYMGSEDNDLDELGHVFLDGERLGWDTPQQGAVGLMRTEGLEPLIRQLEDHLGTGTYARDLLDLLRQAYLQHQTIQDATRFLVHSLFGRFGLLVLVADSAVLKATFNEVLKDELLHQRSHELILPALDVLGTHYKVQAHPRDINLFYLSEQLRERIVLEADGSYRVLHTALRFSRETLLQELAEHPERFSPNVILRGLYQEHLLPNLAFIGGGGELAYWLELKNLFEHYGVPFPLLLLRNSCLWIDRASAQRLDKIRLDPRELFQPLDRLQQQFVRSRTQASLHLNAERAELMALAERISRHAEGIDITLKGAAAAVRTRMLKGLDNLETKMLRAEKRKFQWQTDLIGRLREKLFPGGGLQERVDNLLPYYATYGPEFLDCLYRHLDPANPCFSILREVE